jgi:hypothetical protein
MLPINRAKRVDVFVVHCVGVADRPEHAAGHAPAPATRTGAQRSARVEEQVQQVGYDQLQ